MIGKKYHCLIQETEPRQYDRYMSVGGNVITVSNSGNLVVVV